MTTNKKYTKQSNKQIWDSWKVDINLVQFAEQYGFQIVKKDGYDNNSKGNLHPLETGKHHVCMKKFQFNGFENETLETILIHKNINGEYFYTNPQNTADQGTIIDFIKNKNHTDDWKRIAQIIKDYAGSPQNIIEKPISPINQTPIIKERAVETARYFKFSPTLENPEYLLARGIKKELLFSPQFKGRILNITTTDKINGTKYINIAFPLFSPGGISGAEITNVGFKGFVPGTQKNNSLWLSNINESKPVDGLTIGEAVTDVLSHAQIKSQENKNIIYSAFCGNLGEGQYEHIQKIIDRYQPKEVKLITDNDNAGYRYDINLVGSLKPPLSHFPNPQQSEAFTAKSDLSNKYHVCLTLEFSYDNYESGQKKAEQLKETFLSQNGSVERFTLSNNPVILGDNKGSLKIEYFNSKEANALAYQIVANERGLTDYFVLDKAKGFTKDNQLIEDWNQKLMDILNIDRKNIPRLMIEFRKNDTLNLDDLSKINVQASSLLEHFKKHSNRNVFEDFRKPLSNGVLHEFVGQIFLENQLENFNNYEKAINQHFNKEFNFKEFDQFKNELKDEISDLKDKLNQFKVENDAINKKIDRLNGELVFESQKLDPQEILYKNVALSDYRSQNMAYKKGMGEYGKCEESLNEFKNLLVKKYKVDWSEFFLKTNNIKVEDLKRVIFQGENGKNNENKAEIPENMNDSEQKSKRVSPSF